MRQVSIIAQLLYFKKFFSYNLLFKLSYAIIFDLKKFFQIFEALDHIHKKNVVHRDLKPENILLDDFMNVKITDFGFAKVLKENERLMELCGTPGYLAPETLKASMFENTSGYGKEVDMLVSKSLIPEHNILVIDAAINILASVQ